MKKLKLIVSALLMLIVTLGYSQIKLGDNDELKTENSRLSLIKSNAYNQAETTKSTIDNNNVFIYQIGDDNSAYLSTTAESSLLEVTQYGNQNNVHIDVEAYVINEKVIQIGNNNSFLDYSNFGVDLHSAEIVQKGNDQNLTWFGGNSISENLKITMQGESKTIIVRNFN